MVDTVENILSYVFTVSNIGLISILFWPKFNIINHIINNLFFYSNLLCITIRWVISISLSIIIIIIIIINVIIIIINAIIMIIIIYIILFVVIVFVYCDARQVSNHGIGLLRLIRETWSRIISFLAVSRLCCWSFGWLID